MVGKSKKDIGTRTDSKGQIEMSIDDTPLYQACERMVLSKAQVMGAKDAMDKAEKDWCKEMKGVNKTKINHKGDIIQFVRGKTTDDHARFCKA